MTDITSFSGPYAYMSNFYACEIVMWRGDRVATLEHAFQAEKMTNDFDRNAVMNAPTPGQAKRVARKLSRRGDWEEIKYGVMLYYVRQKFTCHESLKGLLISTGDAQLVEGNDWGDTYWGAVRNAQGGWNGTNWLGQILMKVRSELK